MRKLAHWLEEYDPAESTDLLRDQALSHALRGGALGRKIATLIHGQRFREICEFEFDYAALDSAGYTASQVYHCRQAVGFFSKLENLEIGIDKEKVAWEKFLETEKACSFQNEVMRKYAVGEFQFLPDVESWLFEAQRKIARFLGPVPSFKKLGYRFGPGATSLTKKRLASLREKFSAGVSCSEELVSMAPAILAELPILTRAWATEYVENAWESELTLTDSTGKPVSGVVVTQEFWAQVPIVIHDGRLDFVPKNARTFRSTVTEPVLNGLFQLAVGDHMFDKFARIGQDLRDQTRNQRLALKGSIDGTLATIDLSSASDMIATELVYHLLPLDWACFLSKGRSGHVTYRKVKGRIALEKFSSMGNGFTFPLESLIFWALASAVAGESEVSIMGDDIICPSSAYKDVTRLLEACGFSVNSKKSFSTGVFRESCGADYYRGVDVRPFFQEKWVSGQTLFTLHNFYVRRGMTEDAERVKALIHPDLVIYGPDGYGDGHLIGAHPRLVKDGHRRKGWSGFVFDTFTIKPRRDIRPEQPGDFVLPGYSIYQRTNADLDALVPEEVHPPVKEDGIPPPARLEREAFRMRFLRRAIGFLSGSEALPDVKVGESYVKGTTLPKDVEPAYKRMSIYTFSG